MFYQDQKNETLEKKILFNVTRNAIVIIVLYLLLHLFIAYNTELLIETFYVLSMYLVIFWLIQGHFSKSVIRISAIGIMLSVSLGFFSQGGFFGVPSLDMCLFILILPIIFHGKERIIFISLFIVQIILLGCVQGLYPELIHSDLVENEMPLNLMGFFTRFGNMMYIGYLYKNEYEKEQARIVKINKQLKSMNEQIATSNQRLEGIVHERTNTITWLNRKLVDYAFFNSHKVRGPLARIMGLIYLIQLDTSKKGCDFRNESSEYISRLYESAIELDMVVKEINHILDNGTGDFEFRHSANSIINEK